MSTRNVGHQTPAQISNKQNRSFSAAVKDVVGTRARRTSDWFFASIETSRKEFSGLLVDDEGDPLALLVNAQGYSVEMCDACDACDAIYAHKEYRKLETTIDEKGREHRLCLCGASAWMSHFATFPERLVEPMVLAGTPEHGVCEHCGAPYERIVEQAATVGKDWHPDPARKHEPGAVNGTAKWAKTNAGNARAGDNPQTMSQVPGAHHRTGPPAPKTLGWRPTCSHPLFDSRVIPATVLDPFSGSGRTGIAALRHGRDYVGIELSAKYAAMQRWQLEKAV